MKRLLFALMLSAAGPVGAGTPVAMAWKASYLLHDAQGDHQLTVVCDDTRIELRRAGQPVHVWQRLGDGVELRTVFAHDQRVVAFSPGDLRAFGHAVEWRNVRALVPTRWSKGVITRRSALMGQPVEWHESRLSNGRVNVAWLPNVGLPARYQRTGTAASRLELQSLQRIPAAQGFGTYGRYRVIDAADLGDEQLDPFAKRYVVMGFQ